MTEKEKTQKDLLQFECESKDEAGKTIREKPIVIMGTSGFGTKRSPHLRVYAYGGIIGRIPIEESNAEYHLATVAYEKWLEGDKKEQLKDFLALKSEPPAKRGSSKKDALENPKYLSLICEAARRRFSSLKNFPKERNIQVKIAKRSMVSSAANVVCDMEYCVPKVNDAKQSTDKGKNPNFDLITIDKNGKIGFIELKSEKSSCIGKSGIKEHYKDIQHCLHLPLATEEIKYRYNVLCENGLINRTEVKKAASENKKDTFCGFLFHKSDSLKSQAVVVEICKKELEGFDLSGDFVFFQFVSSVEEVDFDHMQTWQEFCASAES